MLVFILSIIILILWAYTLKVNARVRHIEQYLQEVTRHSSQKKQQGILPTKKFDAVDDTTEEVTKAQTAEMAKNVADSEDPVTLQAAKSTAPVRVATATKKQKHDEAVDLSIDANDAFDRMVEWFKKDWLLKIGALFVIIGFGWFVGYAINQGWISEEMRITLGLAAGVLIALFGSLRMHAGMTHQGEVFIVVGSTIALFTVWAAQHLYEMFPPMVALSMILLTAAYVAIESVRHRKLSLASIGMVFSHVAPYLVNIPNSSFVDLSIYLLIVTAGTIGVTLYTGWYVLAPIAAGLVFLHGLPWLTMIEPLKDGVSAMYSIFVFAIMFFLLSTFGFLKRFTNESALTAYATTIAITGLMLVLWINEGAPETFKAPLMILWAFAFLVGGEYLFRMTSRAAPLVAYGGVAGVLIATATAIIFDGPALTIAYTLESAFVIAIGYLLVRDVEKSQLSSLLYLGPGLLSIGSMLSGVWEDSTLNIFTTAEFWVLTIFMLTSIGLGAMFYFFKPKENRNGAISLGNMFTGVGVVYIYIITGLLFLGEDPALLTIVYTLESLLLVNTVYLVKRSLGAARSVSFVFLVPGFFSLGSFASDAWDTGVFHTDFLALATLSLAFAILAALVYRGYDSTTKEEDVHEVAMVYIVIGSIYAYSLIWLGFHAAFPGSPDAAVTISLLLYTLIGLATYLEGSRRDINRVKWYGVTLLGFVIGRLLLIDVWSMDLVGRIVTFIVIGALLMSTTFVNVTQKLTTSK